MNRIVSLVAAVAAATVLTACGGGFDGDPAATVAAAAETSYELLDGPYTVALTFDVDPSAFADSQGTTPTSAADAEAVAGLFNELTVRSTVTDDVVMLGAARNDIGLFEAGVWLDDQDTLFVRASGQDLATLIEDVFGNTDAAAAGDLSGSLTRTVDLFADLLDGSWVAVQDAGNIGLVDQAATISTFGDVALIVADQGADQAVWVDDGPNGSDVFRVPVPDDAFPEQVAQLLNQQESATVDGYVTVSEDGTVRSVRFDMTVDGITSSTTVTVVPAVGMTRPADPQQVSAEDLLGRLFGGINPQGTTG